VTHTLVVYFHLIATCAAIGTIVITDMRIMAKVLGYKVVIPRPERFETRMISAALLFLYASGSVLVWQGLRSNPEYLSNPKLQAKLVLVVLLTANAFFLHLKIFPILGRSKPVSRWSDAEWVTVAVGVSLSNSLWFFCAFLGIARAWNNTVPMLFVLVVAIAIWAGFFMLINMALVLASREAAKGKSDWIDLMKTLLSNLAAMTDRARRM
jgi:hypothetical protein